VGDFALYIFTRTDSGTVDTISRELDLVTGVVDERGETLPEN
jgi:hypothetical protein